MNGKASKRLRQGALRHYISNNKGKTMASPALVLRRTYKAIKKQYKEHPFQGEGHSAVLKKHHALRNLPTVLRELEKYVSAKGDGIRTGVCHTIAEVCNRGLVSMAEHSDKILVTDIQSYNYLVTAKNNNIHLIGA